MACNSITGCIVLDECSTNVGGVKQIYLTNFDDITGFTVSGSTAAPYGGTVTAIAGPTAQFFYSFTGRKNTASFNDDLTKDIAVGSRFYTQTLNIVLDRRDRAKREQLELLNSGVVVALILDANNIWWVAGLDAGLQVTTNVSGTGTAKTDLNGYTITLVGEESFQALPVATATATALLATCA